MLVTVAKDPIILNPAISNLSTLISKCSSIILIDFSEIKGDISVLQERAYQNERKIKRLQTTEA